MVRHQKIYFFAIFDGSKPIDFVHRRICKSDEGYYKIEKGEGFPSPLNLHFRKKRQSSAQAWTETSGHSHNQSHRMTRSIQNM